MKIKTYGVPELTEWHGKVKAGNLEAKLSFVGGTSSPSGAQPAYLVTKDPITQFVIENSREFKSGFIIPLGTQELPGVHPRMATRKSVPAKPLAEAQDSDKNNSEEAEETIPTPEETESEASAPEQSENVVEVSCLQDAQAYLQENFGISSYKVRTYEAAQNAAAEHGVRFTGVKFDILNESEKAEEATE